MKYLAILITLTGFLWLSWYSQEYVKSKDGAYDDREIHALNDMVARLAPLSQRQAAVLKNIYGLTADDVSNPVDIFGGKLK